VGFPILANKIFYYKDAYFKKRLLPAPKVATLVLLG
jgi:type IV secretion system protein VirD4